MHHLNILVLAVCFWPLALTSSINLPSLTDNVEPKKDESECTKFNAVFLNSLEQKISTLVTTVSSIDVNIKSLQEKSLVWDLFRHHIESWNDQIKSLDHKIDLIKRSQDEGKLVENKLTSLEFTLNHILSKVVYLSDSRNSHSEFNKNDDDKLIEMHKLLNSDKNSKREIVMKLSNILRHVLNIENESCRPGRSSISTKSERIIGPIRTENSIEAHLKNIEMKLSNLTLTWSSKDMKQLSASSRKNTQSLEELLKSVHTLEKQLSDDESKKEFDLSRHCQSISNEITTFTESSDLLLKRIEKLVRDVQTKVDQMPESKSLEGAPETPSTTVANDKSHEISGETESAEKVDIEFSQPSLSGCHDLTSRNDGVYKFSKSELNSAGRDFYERYCSFPTDGIGYTIIQNRGPFKPQENFNRSWAEYREGFGKLDRDFWFGNEFIYRLVNSDNYELRIEMDDFDGVQVWAEYSIFQIDSEKYNYNLMIGGYRGAVTDSMLYHHDQEFSTYDRRNDKSVDACCSCAAGYGSGWWFDNCSEANLNGVYHDTPLGHNYIGIVWEKWHGDYSLKSARMMIRPKTLWNSAEQDDHMLLDP